MKERRFVINHMFFNDPLKLDRVEIVQAAKVFYAPSASCKVHVHTKFFELMAITDGSGTVELNGVTAPIKSGDLVLTFPADTHAIYSSEHNPLEFNSIAFTTNDSEFNEALTQLMTDYYETPSRILNDENISKYIDGIVSELTEKDNFGNTVMLSALADLIVVEAVRVFRQKNVQSTVRHIDRNKILCFRLMRYIDTNLFKIQKLTDLTEVFNYDYSYLSIIFKKTMGKNLSDYFHDKKLYMASLLLKEDQMKICDIAELLNYSSPFAFSKAFKMKYGVSPQSYKKI